MGDDKEKYPKSKFMMCITTLRRVDVENSDGSPAQKFQVLGTHWEKGNGKQFRNSIYEDRANGINRTIQIVSEKPEKFIINQIYMLPTRDRVWIWVEE